MYNDYIFYAEKYVKLSFLKPFLILCRPCSAGNFLSTDLRTILPPFAVNILTSPKRA